MTGDPSFARIVFNTPLAARRWAQFAVLLEGLASNFIWAFGTAFCALRLMDIVSGIRVPEMDDRLGQNVTEHGASLGTGMLQRQVDDMTKGKIDLTLRLNENTGDEAAEIAMLFNPFIGKLHDLVVGLKSYADGLLQSSGDLETLSAAFAESSEQTRTLSSDLGGATKDACACARKFGLKGEIREKASEIANNARDMSEEVATVADAVKGLTRSIEQISGSADATYDITQQANEAAHAGAAGKGFAVVAGEVRQLANEVSQAAQTVKSRIGHMQSQSDEAKESISAITELKGRINKSVSEINMSVNAQQDATGEIADMIACASRNAGDVASAIQVVARDTATVADNSLQSERSLSEAAQNDRELEAEAEEWARAEQDYKDASEYREVGE